jgi:hypothetical protein
MEVQMSLKSKTKALFLVASLLSAFQVQARSSRYEQPFNLDWKFYKGNPSGAQNPTFNDGAWESVSVPHSASYDPPTVAGELGHYGNVNACKTAAVDYWYRKNFNCPSKAQKVFIYFGAVMQSAVVYVNGTQVGTNTKSGYTGFSFDISGNVARGGTNCIAVHAKIANDGTIPPGGFTSQTDGGGPDYLLFSGMYRDVKLLFKDSVYVPRGGLRTATTGTVASPTVHAVTIVKNDSKSAKSVTVVVTVHNKDGVSVATQTSTLSVPANGTSNFDMTTGAVASPLLWSPSSPNLYSLKTVVSMAGTVVDSVVESIGLRFYTWTNTTPGGMSINGVRTEIKGVCMAQFMGWVENAVPNSRFAKQVAVVKAMGANCIRCSHYPRADAFYSACDSIGMLVLAESPTWGCGNHYLPAHWTNINGADSAMVLDAYNHPSIWGWSLFNEPWFNDMVTEMTLCNTIVKGIEAIAPTGRVTLVANPFGGTTYLEDIHGENYATGTSTNLPVVNTEEYSDWTRAFVRGNAMDMDVSSTGEATKEWNDMKNAWSTTDKCAGAHFWCMVDYCSFHNNVGRAGIVDRFYLPKNVYFLFQNNLLGTAPDYWANGTATKIDLAADLTTLRADGTDLCQITATLRNANNACVQQSCVLTFTASQSSAITALYSEESANPKSGNPSVTVTVEGGRAGVLLRASRTPSNGPIVVTVTNNCNLPTVTASVTTVAANETIPNLETSVLQNDYRKTGEGLRLKTVSTMKGIAISFPAGVEKSVRIINCQGKTVAAFILKNGMPALMDGTVGASGVFYAAWDDNGQQRLARLNIVR